MSDASQSMAEASVIEEAPVNNDWQSDKPENHGMDSELLAALHEAALKEPSIHSIVTVKGGYLIDEYYKEGYGKDSLFRLASCSKSFTGALIGIAVGQGILNDADAKLPEFFPQLGEDDAKREIT